MRTTWVPKKTKAPSAPTDGSGAVGASGAAGIEWRHLPTSSASVDQRWAGLAICRQDCSRNSRECGSLRGDFGGQFVG